MRRVFIFALIMSMAALTIQPAGATPTVAGVAYGRWADGSLADSATSCDDWSHGGKGGWSFEAPRADGQHITTSSHTKGHGAIVLCGRYTPAALQCALSPSPFPIATGGFGAITHGGVVTERLDDVTVQAGTTPAALLISARVDGPVPRRLVGTLTFGTFGFPYVYTPCSSHFVGWLAYSIVPG